MNPILYCWLVILTSIVILIAFNVRGRDGEKGERGEKGETGDISNKLENILREEVQKAIKDRKVKIEVKKTVYHEHNHNSSYDDCGD